MFHLCDLYTLHIVQQTTCSTLYVYDDYDSSPALPGSPSNSERVGQEVLPDRLSHSLTGLCLDYQHHYSG